MRLIILIALCLAVASAYRTNNYSNRNRFNRLLRSLRQQQQDQEYGNQGLNNYNNYNDQDEYELDEQDEDDQDNYYQQQRYRQQCRRNQRYGSLNLNDDDIENDSNELYEDQDQYQNQNEQDEDQYRNQRQGRYQNQYEQDDEDQYQRQGRQGRQQRQQGQRNQRRRQQQQQHQCQPKYQLLQELEQANTQLASRLYKQAKQENDDKNTVVGPAAVQLALAAIQRGARGNTKRQIQRVTGAGLTQRQNRQAHTALQQSLHGQDPQQQQQTGRNQQARVKTTTTLIINQRNRAQQRFIQAVQACLNVQVKKCNFQRQPQQCRQQINRYVAQKTNNRLQQAVPQDAVTANTKLIVVNTAQVNAKWNRQFRQQQQTRQGKFYPLGSQQPKPVQVLQSQGQFNYYEDEQLQVVGVPTQQQELTLFVIVPKDKDGLNQIEKTQIQNGQQLKQLLDQAEQQQEHVELELPKIQIKHKIDAKQTLRKQGVQDVFDADEADLSGINGQQQQQQQQRRNRRQNQYGNNDEEDQYNQYEQDQDEQQGQGQQRQQQLHVNKLIHQATIKINEQGISAATPRRGQNQYEQDQDQDQDRNQYQDQDDDENDDEDDLQRQYYQQQDEREELYEELFGQYQRRGGRRQNQYRRYNRRQQGQNRYQGQDNQVQVRANRAFAFALKHNPSNQIVLVGRVVDAAQKPRNQQQQQGRQNQQSLNGVDQQ